MPENIWNKYEKIKEIDNKNSNVKTYLAKIEPIIKEIKPKDKKDYISIYQKLEKIKNEIKIFDIIDENDIIYIVIENNEEINNKVDKMLIEKLEIKKEGIVEGHGTPITKNEILKLFEMEKSMCKIESISKENEKTKGSGFFCKLNNFPIKYALFTNNHILDESNIEIGNKIKFECLEYQKSLFNSSYNKIKKEIEITDKRRAFTSIELDYTCIELFESDGIIDYFEIDPKIFKYNNNKLKNNEIFILQFPNYNEICFSNGKIEYIKDNIIIHNASTEGGSSGSPIIRRSDDNYIIGLHFGGQKIEKKDNYLCNLATNFLYILNNIKEQIKEQINEINCIYIADKDKNEINLLYDYSEDEKKVYMETNKNIYKENMELYINGKKVKFEFKYKMKGLKEINVKFKFNKKMENTSYMFYKCTSLKSIDLSSFNTSNVKDMCYMFYNCSSLKSIDLSSFNTSNVKDMRFMFHNCSSLKSIDLSSFNTSNVNNMSFMFYNCSSLKSIDLSSFNTRNVKDMNGMFSDCPSLESIDLSTFNTSNVNNMISMFNNCSSLKSIDLSSFNTSNVNDMSEMFYNCSSLKSIDLSSFNTSNVNNMRCMFYKCLSLKKDNIKLNKNDNKILKLFK